MHSIRTQPRSLALKLTGWLGFPVAAWVMLAGSPSSAAGCTWAGCDNKDPDLMGCTADAKVARTAFLVDVGFHYVGKVEGMYSPVCGAQWTRVTNWAGYNATLKAAQQQNGFLYGLRSVDNRPPGSYINSRMMSANYFMQAYGESGPPWYSAVTFGY